MKSLVSHLFNAFLKDKSYVFNFLIVLAILVLLILNHDWRAIPNVGSSDTTYRSPANLPDFTQFKDVKQKKSEFFKFLRPKIQRANQKIKYQQALFHKLRKEIDNNDYHNDTAKKKMIRLGVSYGLENNKVLQRLDELSKRIDIIPESLVLAQAANESAWGTSRFSKEANNLFGQWCFSQGCGIIPKSRNANATHEVRKFNSVQEAVTSYMKNLNSHKAYASLRNIRSDMRARGQSIKGSRLAYGLKSYSERGEDYVNEIITMIRQNSLE